MPMPRPFRRVARVLNPAIRPLARQVAPLATLQHIGRHSGRSYETPVMAFRVGEGWIVTLAYGRDVHWLRNIEHTGNALMTRSGKAIRVGSPTRLAMTDAAPSLPAWARNALSMARVRDCVRLDPA